MYVLCFYLHNLTFLILPYLLLLSCLICLYICSHPSILRPRHRIIDDGQAAKQVPQKAAKATWEQLAGDKKPREHAKIHTQSHTHIYKCGQGSILHGIDNNDIQRSYTNTYQIIQQNPRSIGWANLFDFEMTSTPQPKELGLITSFCKQPVPVACYKVAEISQYKFKFDWSRFRSLLKRFLGPRGFHMEKTFTYSGCISVRITSCVP